MKHHGFPITLCWKQQAGAEARHLTARTTRALNFVTECAESTWRDTAPTTTVSLATSISVEEKGFGVKACIDTLAGEQEGGRDHLDSCGSIFIWLLGSLEKQKGICVHKATLKAKGFVDQDVKFAPCALNTDWAPFNATWGMEFRTPVLTACGCSCHR